MSEATGNGELADTLHNLRKAAGLFGQAVGDRAGRSQAWVSRFEGGKRVPAPEDVDALCRIYGASAARGRTATTATAGSSAVLAIRKR